MFWLVKKYNLINYGMKTFLESFSLDSLDLSLITVKFVKIIIATCGVIKSITLLSFSIPPDRFWQTHHLILINLLRASAAPVLSFLFYFLRRPFHLQKLFFSMPTEHKKLCFFFSFVFFFCCPPPWRFQPKRPACFGRERSRQSRQIPRNPKPHTLCEKFCPIGSPHEWAGGRRRKGGGGVGNVSSGCCCCSKKQLLRASSYTASLDTPGYHLYTTWLALFAERTSGGGEGGEGRGAETTSRPEVEWYEAKGAMTVLLVHEVGSGWCREEQKRMNRFDLCANVFLSFTLSVFQRVVSSSSVSLCPATERQKRGSQTALNDNKRTFIHSNVGTLSCPRTQGQTENKQDMSRQPFGYCNPLYNLIHSRSNFTLLTWLTSLLLLIEATKCQYCNSFKLFF